MLAEAVCSFVNSSDVDSPRVKLDFICNVISYYTKLPIDYNSNEKVFISSHANQVKASAKALGIRKKVNEWMLHFQSSSYLLSKYWRALYYYLKTGDLIESVIKYEVDEKDILFSANIIKSSKKLSKLSERYLKNKDIPPILYSDNDIDQIVNEISGKIRRYTLLDMGFILKNDSKCNIDDLLSFLRVVARTAIIRQDGLNNVNFLKNAALSAVKHSISNMITDFNTLKRRTIYQISEKTDDKQAEYLSTIIPIEDDNGNPSNKLPKNKDCSVNYDHIELVRNIFKRINNIKCRNKREKLILFLKITFLGESIPEFDKWLSKNIKYNKKVEKRVIGNKTLYIPEKGIEEKQLRKYAISYTAMSKEDLRLLKKIYIRVSGVKIQEKQEKECVFKRDISRRLLKNSSDRFKVYFRITRLYDYDDDFLEFIANSQFNESFKEINSKSLKNSEKYRIKVIKNKCQRYLDRLCNNELRKKAQLYTGIKRKEIITASRLEKELYY